MPIDPYAALNAMLRAEVTRYTPTAPKPQVRGTDGDDTPAAATATAPVNGSEAPSEG
ncbi:hypothetical protein [Streptomyces sp. NRRL S-244]|uniref:hypothetical protein n=1 Tax=Streptomyces sp. NRRL S-244 TaxID=1463897 RepID=UPI000A64F16B|nr:hypothetical protein [Streptomyces sp. NRRL S-244]